MFCLLKESQRVHATVGACAVGDPYVDVDISCKYSRQPSNKIDLEFWHDGCDVLAASAWSLLGALVEVTLHSTHRLEPREDGFIVVVSPSDCLLFQNVYAISVASNNDRSKVECSIYVVGV